MSENQDEHHKGMVLPGNWKSLKRLLEFSTRVSNDVSEQIDNGETRQQLRDAIFGINVAHMDDFNEAVARNSDSISKIASGLSEMRQPRMRTIYVCSSGCPHEGGSVFFVTADHKEAFNTVRKAVAEENSEKSTYGRLGRRYKLNEAEISCTFNDGKDRVWRNFHRFFSITKWEVEL